MVTASKHPPIILASASPRRQELLVLLGLEFEVRPSDVAEHQLVGESPDQMAQRLSELKAMAGASHRHHLIIAADTLVVVDNQVLGKPESAQQAFDMLNNLRGREHTVITGLTVIDTSDGVWCRQVATTPVLMRDYSVDEIEEYVATGDPMDKAGAYAIQNAIFHPVARIMGCYTNVIGLPVCHLYRGLMQMGIDTPRQPLDSCTWAARFGCRWAQPILSTRPPVDNIEHYAQAQ
ncbi:MAG: Maf family protein [Anaerolineae bacterium]